MHRITIATSVVLPIFLTVAALLLTTAALLLTAGGSLASPPYAPEELVAGGPSAQNAPQCADGIEAWQDDAGDWNVWTGWQLAWAMVEAGTSAQRHPAVSGQVIAFEDDRSGDWDVYAWDASNPADPISETPVATGPGDQLDPAVGGIVVVFEDYSRGNADIGLYDLVSGKTWRLTTNASSQVDPSSPTAAGSSGPITATATGTSTCTTFRPDGTSGSPRAGCPTGAADRPGQGRLPGPSQRQLGHLPLLPGREH